MKSYTGVCLFLDLNMQVSLRAGQSSSGSACGVGQRTEVQFGIFFSGGFIAAIVTNPPER